MDEKITVAHGQTLWSIAKEKLGDGKRWVDLVAKNHEAVAEHAYVRAGTELVLPNDDERWDADKIFSPSGN